MDAPGGSPSPRGHSRKQLRPHKGHPFAATLPSLLRQRRQPLRPLSQARKSVTHASCGSRLAAPVRRPPYVLRLQTVPLTTLLQPVPAGGSHVSIPPPPPSPSAPSLYPPPHPSLSWAPGRAHLAVSWPGRGGDRRERVRAGLMVGHPWHTHPEDVGGFAQEIAGVSLYSSSGVCIHTYPT